MFQTECYREKFDFLTSNVRETSEDSESGDWGRIYEWLRRNLFQYLTRFSYLASPAVDELCGQFVEFGPLATH